MNQASGMCDLTDLLVKTPKNSVVTLDAEGAPIKLSQISIVCSHNGASKQLYNTYCEGGVLTEGKKQNLVDTLNRAKILVGYNIDSDMKALSLQGVTIPNHILIVDLYYTFQYLREQKQAPFEGGCALEDVASYYGINDVTGYHNSLVDSKVTMNLFWRMVKKTKGFLWVVSSHTTKVNDNLKSLYTKEVNKHMENFEFPDMMDYSYEEPEALMKTDGGFYQGMVVMGRKERLVRLSKKEYKLLKKIRKLVPNYPLSVFYTTIVVPGAQEALRSFEENKENETSAVVTENEAEKAEPENQQDTCMTNAQKEEDSWGR